MKKVVRTVTAPACVFCCALFAALLGGSIASANEAPTDRWIVRSVTTASPQQATYFDPELKKPFFLSEGSVLSEDCLICLEGPQSAVDLTMTDAQGQTQTERINGPAAAALANLLSRESAKDFRVTQVLVQEGSIEAYQQIVLSDGRRVDVSRVLIKGETSGAGDAQKTEANKIRINPCGYSVTFFEPHLELTSAFDIYPAPEDMKPKPETTGEVPKAEVADAVSAGK